MDFGLIGKIVAAGNGEDERHAQLPSEPTVDLPSDVTSIERTELFVITQISLKGQPQPFFLDDPIRVFGDKNYIDGRVTEFEIQRDPIRGHRMIIYVAAPVFDNQPVGFDTTKYKFAKKITP